MANFLKERENSRVYTYNARETILKVNDAFINLHQWSQKYVKYDTVVYVSVSGFKEDGLFINLEVS